jgi:hypothetical protein
VGFARWDACRLVPLHVERGLACLQHQCCQHWIDEKKRDDESITINSDLNCEVSGDLSHAQIGSDSLRQVQNRFSLGFIIKGARTSNVANVH